MPVNTVYCDLRESFGDRQNRNDEDAVLTKSHQLSMFKKHSSQIVCIDATHCNNQYAFPLVTLLV